ncbi:hypothetical protein SeMB42_g00689 [Synchytrium endobioticum]|uniref:TRAF3-interacting protein 1 n=1 Tax=Synchytrium endobioticum TaxID=286115 RepID=A0A507DBQ5_9FUNG|nr:hypothetical protein SeLEV6574_g02147 [Synchytrium endobioticum]TPX53573.1 hypothetical protein SeMB42_g00689 [Synchytrium endobioticum]
MATLEDSTKKTADILGRFIKKTPLTNKLLAKPPFRYLHDLVTESIATTGWAKGLFDENESNSANVTEKDAKVAYLQKIIDTVSLSTGVQVKANPTKIVSGLEPDETNAFLQLLGKAVIKKVDSTEAVRQVLAGSGRPPRSYQETEDVPDTEHQLSERPARPPSASHNARRPPPPESVKKVSSEEHTSVKSDRRKSDAVGKSETNLSKKFSSSSSPTKPPKPPSSEPRKQSSSPSRSTKAPPGKAAAQNSIKAGRTVARTEAPPSEFASRDTLQAAPSADDVQETRDDLDEGNDQQPLSATFGSTNEMSPIAQPQQEASMMDEDRENSQNHNSSPMLIQQQQRLPPRPSSRMAPRPTTAKPPPPREKKNKKDADEASSNTPVVYKADTIDDEFLVSHTEEDVTMTPASATADEKHGGLVRKILETKRDFDSKENMDANKSTGPKDKSYASKEIESVRTLIQSLCKSVMPLGSTLDYIQEDLDAMNREFGGWRAEANRYKQMLNDEVNQTEEMLQPLQVQLKVVESSIEEQLEKISAAKALIVQNDETIRRLVCHVVGANP